jgi:CBS domain-containing protein
MTLSDLLQQKSPQLVSVRASASVLEATRLMIEHRVGSLLVESDEGRLVGIATERDILRFCSQQEGAMEKTPIEAVMTTDVIVASPDCDPRDAMAMMTEHRFRHLPVIEEGRPVGLISIGDLVKAELEDVRVEVKYLRDYISA